MKRIRITENKLRSLIHEAIRNELNEQQDQRQIWNELYKACLNTFTFNDFISEVKYDCEIKGIEYTESAEDMQLYKTVYEGIIDSLLNEISHPTSDYSEEIGCRNLGELYDIYRNDYNRFKEIVDDFMVSEISYDY